MSRNCHADRLSGRGILRPDGQVMRQGQRCILGGALYLRKGGLRRGVFLRLPLRCVFCQNSLIAEGGAAGGRKGASGVFLRLQERREQYQSGDAHPFRSPDRRRAQTGKAGGLRIPVVYNTGSYEKAETLKLLEGLVDIYLPDLKYASSGPAGRYSHAPDYFETACQAIAEMVRQVPEAVFEKTEAGERLMKRGVIVRHLLLPGQSMDSRRVLRYLHETYGNRIYISIMNQYTPMRRFDAYPELNRRVSGRVYERLVDSALALGIENGFIQEGGTAKESFVPLWDGTGL